MADSTQLTDKAWEAKRKDYQDVFGSDAGQHVLRDLMSTFNMASPVYMKGDTNETMFAEGGRNVVLYILHQLREPVDPKRFRDQMQQAEYDYSLTT